MPIAVEGIGCVSGVLLTDSVGSKAEIAQVPREAIGCASENALRSQSGQQQFSCFGYPYGRLPLLGLLNFRWSCFTSPR